VIHGKHLCILHNVSADNCPEVLRLTNECGIAVVTKLAICCAEHRLECPGLSVTKCDPRISASAYGSKDRLQDSCTYASVPAAVIMPSLAPLLVRSRSRLASGAGRFSILLA